MATKSRHLTENTQSEHGELYNDVNDIMWAPMQFDGITKSMVEQMAKEVKDVPEEYWYWCTYRNCWLLMLYGNGTNIDNKQIMEWMPFTENMDTLKGVYNEFFSPLFTTKPRIIIIRTEPGRYMPPHVDCAAQEFETLNPKIRLVLSGKIDTLTFYGQHERKIPDTYPAYYMSGNSAHSMHNDGDQTKYTLCFGDPWLGDDLENQNFVDHMKKMMTEHADEVIRKSDLGPIDLTQFEKDRGKEEIYGREEFERRLQNGGYTGLPQ